MKRIKSSGSKAEIAVRKLLSSKGYRYRLHDKRYPGKPDIVLPKHKTIIQVNGCFWHGHTCIDGHLPKTKRSYWIHKLASNKSRDRSNTRKLKKLGWKVLVVWECQCLKKMFLLKVIKNYNLGNTPKPVRKI